ncbi:MAG: hypothetical protein AAF705_19245, partial [Bacteroidota bacterium]
MKELIKIEEPKLLFGYNQAIEDPRDGLTLFGPVDDFIPYGITNGVVGTKEGLAKFKHYVTSIQRPVFNANNKTRPFFPGFEAAFRAKWDADKTLFVEITPPEIQKLLYHEDTHTRVYNLVNLYADKIWETIEDEDAKADVWYVIVPEELYRYCRPKSSLPKELVAVKRKTTASSAKKMLSQGTSL